MQKDVFYHHCGQITKQLSMDDHVNMWLLCAYLTILLYPRRVTAAGEHDYNKPRFMAHYLTRALWHT